MKIYLYLIFRMFFGVFVGVFLFPFAASALVFKAGTYKYVADAVPKSDTNSIT